MKLRKQLLIIIIIIIIIVVVIVIFAIITIILIVVVTKISTRVTSFKEFFFPLKLIGGVTTVYKRH